MGEVIGELLPLALGVAISPVPVIAVILMLLAPQARASSVAFLVGWVAGIAVVVTVVTLVLDPVDDSEPNDPSTLVSVIRLLLGAAAVVLAVKQWRSRPGAGADAALPKWISTIDTLAPVRAFGLGALLSGVNPKNLALCVTAGVVVGSSGLSAGETAGAVSVFVGVGSLSVAVPVVGYLVAQRRMQRPLDELRQWLTTNNTVVIAVMLLVLGVVIIGNGLEGL